MSGNKRLMCMNEIGSSVLMRIHICNNHGNGVESTIFHAVQVLNRLKWYKVYEKIV